MNDLIYAFSRGNYTRDQLHTLFSRQIAHDERNLYNINAILRRYPMHIAFAYVEQRARDHQQTIDNMRLAIERGADNADFGAYAAFVNNSPSTDDLLQRARFMYAQMMNIELDELEQQRTENPNAAA